MRSRNRSLPYMFERWESNKAQFSNEKSGEAKVPISHTYLMFKEATATYGME